VLFRLTVLKSLNIQTFLNMSFVQKVSGCAVHYLFQWLLRKSLLPDACMQPGLIPEYSLSPGALMGWLVLRNRFGPLVYGISFGIIAGAYKLWITYGIVVRDL